mmetsp:Transcript_7108/g.20931  ORF Transcript_7108/g.20931 Transcript_7108/m.20931 type:complete len:638 (+) Transcript_7108:108-2021(+)
MRLALAILSLQCVDVNALRPALPSQRPQLAIRRIAVQEPPHTAPAPEAALPESADPAAAADGAVSVGGETILTPAPGRRRRWERFADVDAGRDEDDGGVFLSFKLRKARALVDVDLGLLPEGRVLAIARTKRWWMAPTFGAVPVESQAVLVEGPADARGLRTYSCVLPLLTGQDAFRCTVRGREEGARTRLVARCESGDPAVRSDLYDGAVYVGARRARDAGCVHELLAASVAAAARRTGTFRPLALKAPPSGQLEGLGWCTWDAFYSSVDAGKVAEGLETLRKAGGRVRRLVVDDGWMALDREVDADSLSGEILDASAAGESFDALYGESVVARCQRAFAEGVAGAYARHVERAPPDSWGVTIWRALARTVLRAPLVHFFDESTDFTRRIAWPPRPSQRKFGGEAGFEAFLRDVVKGTYGVAHVSCWHAAAGYWGGVDAPGAEVLRARATPHLRSIEPAIDWDPASLGGVATPTTPDDVRAVYDALYASLKRCGVDGVKADAQSGVGALGRGHGGGVAAVRSFVEAMEAAGERHFGAGDEVAVSNCMCHSTENLYRYSKTAIARASDDFYPREPESWFAHLTACAYNSLLLGQVALPDWDMFQSQHPAAWLHAAARAASGVRRQRWRASSRRSVAR